MESLNEQKKGYEIYSSIMKAKMKVSPTGVTSKNRVKVADKVIDSLNRCCGYKVFFDDMLFHVGKNIVIIDTFNFFDSHCMISKFNVSVLNKLIDFSCASDSYDIIQLKSVRVYRNRFIIALQHLRSSNEVYFAFELVANYPPRLDEITKGYLE